MSHHHITIDRSRTRDCCWISFVETTIHMFHMFKDIKIYFAKLHTEHFEQHILFHNGQGASWSQEDGDDIQIGEEEGNGRGGVQDPRQLRRSMERPAGFLHERSLLQASQSNVLYSMTEQKREREGGWEMRRLFDAFSHPAHSNWLVEKKKFTIILQRNSKLYKISLTSCRIH